MFLLSWLSLAQIHTRVRCFLFFCQALMSSLLSWLYWSPIYSYWSLSWRCTQLRGTRRLCPLVHLTSLQFPYSMEQSSSCTYGPAPIIPWTQTRWLLSSILWSSPCWTQWSTAWGTRRSRVHSRRWLRRHSFLQGWDSELVVCTITLFNVSQTFPSLTYFLSPITFNSWDGILIFSNVFM